MMGRFLLGLWLTSLAVLLTSCSETATDGSETPVDIARKVQAAPVNANLGVRRNDPVAMFVFSQFADDTIRLTVENIISNEDVTSISFAFEVSFQPQVVSPSTPPWDNQGAVTNLARGQIADAGIIAVSATPVSMGEIEIDILGEITYK
jgi:hypothetical protein